MWIAMDLTLNKEELLIHMLNEHWDVFSLSYKDLKDVDPNNFQHTILMREDVKEINNIYFCAGKYGK